MDRGKVLWEEDLERLQGKWGRYQDVEGDGIPYRTLPGNRHPAAAYFTRGTGHDENARYSEDNEVWHDLLERLKAKFETARQYVPAPVVETTPGARIGVISFGSTLPAIEEARYQLQEKGIPTDFLRVRAVPFTEAIAEFIRQHSRIYVVEMNRDGQLIQLLTLEYPQEATRLRSIAYTDGLPLTAQFVRDAILAQEEK
jgi:2-oxoglutarate ferredoxin oxidoreductase subunit alpha